MKLTFWKIPGLVTHQGFAILDVVERPGLLQASGEGRGLIGLRITGALVQAASFSAAGFQFQGRSWSSAWML
jgi:hypothetical protein